MGYLGRMLPRPVFLSLLAAGLVLTAAGARGETPILPLTEVKPGMRGEWRTVVRGNQIRSFPLVVLGLSEHFIAPGVPAILCEALDEENRASGPVAGMSGSPVYFDGRLAGAYAYGFLLAKDQALIGVTPIESMLGVLDMPRAEGDLGRPPPAGPARPVPIGPYPTQAVGGLSSLPTPFMVAGASERVLAPFRTRLEALGLRPMAGPAGGPGGLTTAPLDLVPGAPLSVLLMDGDLGMHGVGTVTWREGNRVLGFGHPMFGDGRIELPAGGAEILTVARSYLSSFKVSNPGPATATLVQDRLAAVEVEMGRTAPTTALSLQVSPEGRPTRTYKSRMARHRSLSPLLSAIGHYLVMTQAPDADASSTWELTTRWTLAGFPPITTRDLAAGPGGDLQLAIRHLIAFGNLLESPDRLPEIVSVESAIRVLPGIRTARLEGLTLMTREAHAGKRLDLVAEVRHWRGERTRHRFSLPVPADASGSRLTVMVGDAGAAESEDDLDQGGPLDLAARISRLAERRSRSELTAKLLRPSRGTVVSGARLRDLPASIRDLMVSSRVDVATASLDAVTVAEVRLDLGVEVEGRKSMEVEVP